MFTSKSDRAGPSGRICGLLQCVTVTAGIPTGCLGVLLTAPTCIVYISTLRTKPTLFSILLPTLSESATIAHALPAWSQEKMNERFSAIQKNERFSAIQKNERFSAIQKNERFSAIQQNERFSAIQQNERFSAIQQNERFSAIQHVHHRG